VKKQRLFREEIKDRHTSHWDLDMMTREELEAAMAQKADKTEAEPEKEKAKEKEKEKEKAKEKAKNTQSNKPSDS
jgi:hypothetical protein